MPSVADVTADTDLVPVPRGAVVLPLLVPTPPGFDPARVETWPAIDGELEFVQGHLLYMPPSGDLQQDTCADVLGLLHAWRKANPGFVVAGNEAGVHLGGETRGVDAAVWRRADLPAYRGGFRNTPPLLAVEVAGKYDDEDRLRSKARWYLDHGTRVVWLLFPVDRRVIVLAGGAAEVALGPGQQVPTHEALPGLAPAVTELFEQISS